MSLLIDDERSLQKLMIHGNMIGFVQQIRTKS